MASLRPLAVVRRSLIARSFHTTALRQGGRSPPMPPFKRSPAKWETLTENYDAVWDDGVAPELALDFDAPNVSSREALWTAVGAFFGIFVFHQTFVHAVCPENPALPHSIDCVGPDYTMGERELKK